MSLTIDTLLKSQGEVHLTEIEVNWYFTPQNDEENSLEIQGTYNIDSYYDSHTSGIQRPRTQITGFYEIFNKLKFTDIATQSTFIMGINHITEYELSDQSLSVEFVFHRSVPQIAFNIEQPIIAGAADIQSESENLLMLQSLIHKNLHLHFSDHVFKIPRCNRCSSALTVHNQVDLEDEVINEDFVCMDCYSVMNNFFNLLENEVYKITEHEQMKEQRDTLVKFLMTGKKNAAQIEETQLQHFYNLLIIYVEYLSGNLDPVNVLVKIQAVQTIGANQNFPLLQQEAENLLNKFDFGPQEEESQEETVPSEPQTWTPPVEPEPTPPPLPAGTPSAATILPQDPVITEGLQSLEEVQAELQSTLEALSQIESDLSPKPISPTDNMHAVNMDMENGESDKIPTYDDIKETFSDLESIDFPDIQFGTDSSTTEDYSEEDQILDKVQQNLESTPATLNPPPGSTQDYQDDTTPSPPLNMPIIRELPSQESKIEELEPVQELNPPLEAPFPEETSGYEGEIEKEDLSEIPLNPPMINQGDQLNPQWRDISETTPPPQMNPPPQVNPPLEPVTPPQMNPPPQVNPPLEPVTPPQMNPPPQVNPPLEPVTPPQMNPPPQVNQPLEPITPPPVKKQVQDSKGELNEDKEVVVAFQNTEDKPPVVVGGFFNNGKNGPNAIIKPKKEPRKASGPKQPPKPVQKPSPKETRKKRDRSSKNRRIICSFCGQTINQGKKKCPNCGVNIS